MAKQYIYLCFLMLLFNFAYAETSSSSINWLSKPYADTLYCRQNGDCNLTTLNAINQTVTNYNITGNFCIGGVCYSNLTVFLYTDGSNSEDIINFKKINATIINATSIGATAYYFTNNYDPRISIALVDNNLTLTNIFGGVVIDTNSQDYTFGSELKTSGGLLSLGTDNFYANNGTFSYLTAFYFIGNGTRLTNICLSNGTNCKSSPSSNPFDQSLNTTDSPTFTNIDITGTLNNAGSQIMELGEHILYAGDSPAYMINFYTSGVVDFYDNNIITTSGINASSIYEDNSRVCTEANGICPTGLTNPVQNITFQEGGGKSTMTNAYNWLPVQLYNLTFNKQMYYFNSTNFLQNVAIMEDRFPAISIQDLGVPPINRRRNLFFQIHNWGVTNIQYRPLIKFNGEYFPITAGNTVNANGTAPLPSYATTYIDNPNQFAIQCIGTVNCTNITISYTFDEFDNSSPIFTAFGFNITTNQTLVQAALGEILRPIEAVAGTTWGTAAALMYVSGKGVAPVINWYIVPNGDIIQPWYQFGGATVPPARTASGQLLQGVLLTNQDSLMAKTITPVNQTYLAFMTFTRHFQ